MTPSLGALFPSLEKDLLFGLSPAPLRRLSPSGAKNHKGALIYVASEERLVAAGAQQPELTGCSMRIVSTAGGQAIERSSKSGFP
ncbi:hypothetical protein [Billgrantia aerodenitrificans]|uniref:Uncharacterized protein n=1 Tax=Billgrantia aerodenitrificans TaxID=2733483 RepID=A0ABS9ASP4_9GAMM|nr:hypothetical protein [Halomonas aerodenitrificans]MCE8024535.1 hypothetical protein [Halomonas aerodenitrificans]